MPSLPKRATIREVLGNSAAHLVPDQLLYMDELLDLEFSTAMSARRWALARKRSDVASVAFLIKLHAKMFGGIWRWAGQLRRSDHVDGVRWPTIGIELNDLVGEVRFWLERRLYSPDELAIRFFYRLVRIRAWEGGNGSHARLAADALAVAMNRPPFQWGRARDDDAGLRERYSVAVREADSGLMQPLVAFARGN